MFAKVFIASVMASAALANVIGDIKQSMTEIGKLVDNMTSDVNSWDGAATTAVKLLDDSKAVKAAINQWTQTLSADKKDEVGLFDAITILAPTNALTAQVDQVVKALQAKKSQIQAAALGPVVLQELKDQKFAANDLATAIVGTLPSLAQAIGGPMAQQIVTKLDGAVNTFST